MRRSVHARSVQVFVPVDLTPNSHLIPTEASGQVRPHREKTSRVSCYWNASSWQLSAFMNEWTGIVNSKPHLIDEV